MVGKVRLLLVGALLVAHTGCLYQMGRNVTEGMLDEAIGEDREGGAEELGTKVLEKQLAAEIGYQLGAGIKSGATDLTDEQRRQLEQTIDALLTVTALKTGEGVRRDLSPAMRQMVRDDIVRALADGMRGEVAGSLEETADRVVTQAIVSLRREIEDPETRMALSDMIRDSFYLAMTEGSPQAPGVGETIESTLSENVLNPFEDSVGGLADTVADKVEQQARRTENTLRAIIAFLGFVLGAVLLAYAIARRQLLKEREHVRDTEQDLRNLDVALGLLDDTTRQQVMGKLGGLSAKKKADPDLPPSRSDDYFRSPKK